MTGELIKQFHVSRKCSDYERKFWESEKGYLDNPTSFSGFAAGI